jgi:cytochrome c oxidase subunit II
MDMVPGAVTYFWFTPTRKGTYDVLCAELCGVAHAQMRAKVTVGDESEYNAWLAKQQTFAQATEKARKLAANVEIGAGEGGR